MPLAYSRTCANAFHARSDTLVTPFWMHRTSARCAPLPTRVGPQVLSLRSVGEVGPGSELAGLPSLTHLDLAWCGSIRGQQVGAGGQVDRGRGTGGG